MKVELLSTGTGKKPFHYLLSKKLISEGYDQFGAAVAYISVYGIMKLCKIIETKEIGDVYLVCNISDFVTQPNALEIAIAKGFNIRVYNQDNVIFHPKYYICGNDILSNKNDTDITLVVGSNNISKRGFEENYESSVCIHLEGSSAGARSHFANYWEMGTDLSNKILQEYSKNYSFRNRGRDPLDLQSLDFGSPEAEVRKKLKRTPLINPLAATSAWAGLQSFTGEYRFQLEFPRRAGEVLARIVGPFAAGNVVPIRCGDGLVREMNYRYYSHNSMFRLNIPNEVPGVSLARENKTGIAVVELSEGGKELALRIIQQSDDEKKLILRSELFGTIGSTPTRSYGWF